MYKAPFRVVYNLYKLYSRGYKWLCYAAFNAGICTLFMLRYHTCTNCILKANHASNVGFAVTDAHWITVSSSRSSQFLCICQMLSKSSGQIFSSHIGSKNVSCFCQIMSLCRWDTYKMCAKIWGSWTENFCVSVTQNRSVHGTDSRSISLKKKENYFNSDPWICLLNRIIKLLWS